MTSTEHPILQTGLMVRAILDGQKTQARLLFKKPPPQHWSIPPARFEDGYLNQWGCSRSDESIRCPYSVGDRLWVRETFTLTNHGTPVYRADGTDANGNRWPSLTPGDPNGEAHWRPSVHMPKWACRITLEITRVWVEQIQQISTNDAQAEGVRFHDPYWLGSDHAIKGTQKCFISPEQAFADIWDSTYAKRGKGWDQNPFVWCVEFERIENVR